MTDTAQGLLEIMSRYTKTFLLLQRYDEGQLLTYPNGTIGGVTPSYEEAKQLIAGLKTDLMCRGEASHLFGIEPEEVLSAILGNLNQSVLGKPAYPTVECKSSTSALLHHQKSSSLRWQ